MADVLHSNLTGADLHECKGASTATIGQVPVATGSGTATFAALNWNYIVNKPAIPVAYYNGAIQAAPAVRNFSTTASGGNWSISISGLTAVHTVQATCTSVAGASTAYVATVNSVSPTGVSGQVILVGGSPALGSTQTVYVTVWGV